MKLVTYLCALVVNFLQCASHLEFLVFDQSANVGYMGSWHFGVEGGVLSAVASFDQQEIYLPMSQARLRLTRETPTEREVSNRLWVLTLHREDDGGGELVGRGTAAF